MGEDAIVLAARDALRERLASPVPAAVLILGSGLGSFVNRIDAPVHIPWSDLPGFASAGVAGHAGDLVAGLCGGTRILCQCGRSHAYEGHAPVEATLPVRVYAALGVTTLLVTNAAGGIRPGLMAGSLMLLADQINLTFRNPLLGPVLGDEVRFPDMSGPYDRDLRALTWEVARRERILLTEGVYAGVVGPSYETPAEIRMLARAGADAVGMSTVLEVITARARGLRCLGLSTITNRAAGLTTGRLTHEEVLRVGAAAGERLGRLLAGVIGRL
jgi:purine-nucleoside phosphorylase